MEFPEGFGYLITGQNAEMQTSTDSLILALSLALFLVYIVMASQFESLVHPFIIMFTVPWPSSAPPSPSGCSACP